MVKQLVALAKCGTSAGLSKPLSLAGGQPGASPSARGQTRQSKLAKSSQRHLTTSYLLPFTTSLLGLAPT